MERVSTTFNMDFAIADRFGESAVLDTFERAIKEWRHDIRYIAELALALNGRCWLWYSRSEECGDGSRKSKDCISLSEIYADLYYRVRDLVYGDASPYTEEEQGFYFDVTD